MNTTTTDSRIIAAVNEVFSDKNWACTKPGEACVNPRCKCYQQQCLLHQEPTRT